MNPNHSPENAKNDVSELKPHNEIPKISLESKDVTSQKESSLSSGEELVEETSNSIYPKTFPLSPKLRGKLKPEQSYKKETKASRLGKSTGRWTQQEHVLFIEGLKIFGKNWKKVESYIGTRTGTQIRSHAQKFFNRIKKEHQTEDPSKYVIDNMGDDDVKRIVLEHLGEESSLDTPEVLFSITKEKTKKRKRKDAPDTPRSVGTPGGAFKSFKRSETDGIAAPEDSKAPTILKKPVCVKPSKPLSFSNINPVMNNQFSTTNQNLPNLPNQGLSLNSIPQDYLQRLLIQALLVPAGANYQTGFSNGPEENMLKSLISLMTSQSR